MKKSYLVILVVIVLAVGGYFIYKPKASTYSAPNSTSTSASSESVANTIVYSSTGFSPATMTVKAGIVLTIKNTSSSTLQMQSNPHPAHTDDNDLNVGTVAAGSSKTFTVTKTGSFGFHNHLNPSDAGKIVIE
jgi:plastocyanin